MLAQRGGAARLLLQQLPTRGSRATGNASPAALELCVQVGTQVRLQRQQTGRVSVLADAVHAGQRGQSS